MKNTIAWEASRPLKCFNGLWMVELNEPETEYYQNCSDSKLSFFYSFENNTTSTATFMSINAIWSQTHTSQVMNFIHYPIGFG